MSERPWWRAGALAVLSLFSGCRCASEHPSAPATSSSGRWRKAVATVSYHPSYRSHGHPVAPSVLHALTIEDDTSNHAYLVLASAYEDGVAGPLFQALRETRYQVRLSPDDSTLAASTDEGASWTLFDLRSLPDTTQQPFSCRHQQVTSLSPWPSMRDLALELMASVDPASAAARAHRGPELTVWPEKAPAGPSAYRWKDEVLGAVRYACARPEDSQLRAALLQTYLSPDAKDVDFKYDVNACVAKLAAEDPAARAALEASVAGRDDNWKAHVAWLLEQRASAR